MAWTDSKAGARRRASRGWNSRIIKHGKINGVDWLASKREQVTESPVSVNIMKIIDRNKAIYVKKPEGIKVWYYLFPEYEIHYNEQPPHTTQTWHFHKKIHETIFIIGGELKVYWEDDSSTKNRKLSAGDLVETQNSNHTFKNDTDNVVRFLVLKQVLSGENKSNILKNDKIVVRKDL